ncbi:stevor, partial [Plasmodium reichenowi]
GRYGAEPMSTLEKELLETYEEVFGEENHIMLKSGRYPNDDDESDDSSSCECTDINGVELAKTKGRDKYLKHLKHRCIGGICSCSVGSVFITLIGLLVAKAAAISAFKKVTATIASCSECASSITISNMFNNASMLAALEKCGVSVTAAGVSDGVGSAVGVVMGALYPWGIAALVLLILAVVLIILYIWLYKRRKNSWKHECKKHLCK